MSAKCRNAKLALVVSALSLTAGTAWAGTPSSLTSSNIIFATQAVSASGGAITLPATGANPASLSYTTGALTGSASSTGSFTLVFTLPNGVSTASAVATVTTAGGGAACVTGNVTGMVSSNTIAFTVNTTNTGTAGNTCTVTLGTLSLTGATALSTATTSTTNGSTATGFTISARVTSVSNSTVPADSNASQTALASSANALSITSIYAPAPAASLDLIDTSGDTLNGVKSFGKGFTSGTTEQNLVAATGAGGSGAFVTSLSTSALNAAATGPFLATGTTGTIALTGNLSGVASMFLDTSSATAPCASRSSAESSLATAIAGVMSGSTATFSNVPAGPNTLCVYASGTSLVGTNPNGVQIAASFGSASANGSTAAAPTGIYATKYSSGTPYFVTYGGNLSGYPSFTRVVNNTTMPIRVYAEVQTDNGSLGTGEVATGLSAQTNALVADSTILTNAGVSPDSTGRASFIIWVVPANANIENAGATTFGPGAVGVSHLLVNPDGTVVPLGSSSGARKPE